jgi:hypothetical protein
MSISKPSKLSDEDKVAEWIEEVFDEAERRHATLEAETGRFQKHAVDK